jgi:hypothetical protein
MAGDDCARTLRRVDPHAQSLGIDAPVARRTKLFHDLRRSNEYGARVARLIEAQRERRIERVIQAQRRLRVHQSR